MTYHTVKVQFQDRMIRYCLSDEVLRWLFIPDYNTYLKRCDILVSHVTFKMLEKAIQIIKEKNNASNNNS